MRVPLVLSIAIYVICILCVGDVHGEAGYNEHPPAGACQPAPGGGSPPSGGYPGSKPCRQYTLFGISNAITSKILKQIIDTRTPKKYESFTISVFNILHVIFIITNAACKETSQQLLKYLDICSLSEVNKEFQNYRPQLQQNVTFMGDQEVLIRTYAGLFPASDFKLLQNYVSQMKRVYGADVQSVPYRTNEEKARKTINERIKNATFNFYPKFFTSKFAENTVLVLVATLYVQISWQRDYFYLTEKAPFYQIGGAGTIPKIQYLNNKQGVGPASHAIIDKYEFVLIPLYADKFSLILFYAQNKKEDPATYLRTLTATKIVKIFNALKNVTGCQANVTIPEFGVKSKYSNDLMSFLEAGGVKDLFTRADLCKAVKPSPKSDKLKVSQLRHDASVSADKNGILAVATTVATVTTTAIQICQNQQFKQFYANCPFGYFIADRENKLVLFSGIVYKP